MLSITDSKLSEIRSHLIAVGFHNANDGAFDYSLVVKEVGKSDLKLFVSLLDCNVVAIYLDKKYNEMNRYGEKEKRVEFRFKLSDQPHEIIHNIDKFINSVAKENFS